MINFEMTVNHRGANKTVLAQCADLDMAKQEAEARYPGCDIVKTSAAFFYKNTSRVMDRVIDDGPGWFRGDCGCDHPKTFNFEKCLVRHELTW